MRNWKAQAINAEGSVKIGIDCSTEVWAALSESDAAAEARAALKAELKRRGKPYFGFRMSQAKHWSDVQLAKIYK